MNANKSILYNYLFGFNFIEGLKENKRKERKERKEERKEKKKKGKNTLVIIHFGSSE